jgi:hypothetical protein
MPEMKIFKDGNAWCFVLPDFENLQVSPAVFSKLDNELDKIYSELLDQKSKEEVTE